MRAGDGLRTWWMAMREAIAMLPGSTTSCVLFTLLAILVAVCSDYPHLDAVLRTLYFAVLFGFFHSIGRRQPEIRVLPFRLIVAGFGVLTLGHACSAVIFLGGVEPSNFVDLLSVSLERGAVFLLGLTLISFGIVVWIPQLLDNERRIRRRYSRTKGELQKSEQVRSTLEEHFADADRLRALGELAAGIAHDLRNPLAIVKATAESMGRRPRSREETIEHIKVIDRNLEKADRTIAALLDLGRPCTFELTSVQLDRVLTDLQSLISVQQRRQHVRIVRRGDQEIAVQADPKLLQRAVLNLLLNALQATAPGGEIEVLTRKFSLGGREYGVLVVADRGVGIEPDARSRLFTPFFTTKVDGIGLGLLSTRRVVAEMRGKVGLYPRHRGGARAVLALPLAGHSIAPLPGEVALT